jgi:protein-tyrosine-phosphatase
MTRTILFTCPHNAAKSIIACAYFERLAQQNGLNVDVRSGGTEPDGEVAPAVAAQLQLEGFEVFPQLPRLLTQVDIDQADCVISLGCPLDQFDLAKTPVVQWNDIPSPSQNLDASRATIMAHVVDLVAELRHEAKP